jgi:hypothetical protein
LRPGRLGLLTASDKEGAGRHVEEDQADRVGLDTQVGGWFCPRPLRKISPPPPIEQVATAEQRFDQLDADLNGLISPEEFRHAVSKARNTEELFRAADANRTIRSAERSGRIGREQEPQDADDGESQVEVALTKIRLREGSLQAPACLKSTAVLLAWTCS